jgi:hypothetical protein
MISREGAVAGTPWSARFQNPFVAHLASLKCEYHLEHKPTEPQYVSVIHNFIHRHLRPRP